MNKVEIMDKIAEIAEDVGDKAGELFEDLKDRIVNPQSKNSDVQTSSNYSKYKDDDDDDDNNGLMDMFKDAMFNIGEGVETIGEKIKDKFSK